MEEESQVEGRFCWLSVKSMMTVVNGRTDKDAEVKTEAVLAWFDIGVGHPEDISIAIGSDNEILLQDAFRRDLI